MKTIKQIISENLLQLRKENHLTQLELADKLNYSDKAVSRWEQGVALPDIEVLCDIAALYGVSFEYLITEGTREQKSKYITKGINKNKFTITMLAISLVWLVATIAFVYAKIISDEIFWRAFIWAVPISCLVALVFNSIWGNRRNNYGIVSALGWSAITAVYLQFVKFNIWPMFLLGAPMQIAVILWSTIKRKG